VKVAGAREHSTLIHVRESAFNITMAKRNTQIKKGHLEEKACMAEKFHDYCFGIFQPTKLKNEPILVFIAKINEGLAKKLQRSICFRPASKIGSHVLFSGGNSIIPERKSLEDLVSVNAWPLTLAQSGYSDWHILKCFQVTGSISQVVINNLAPNEFR
jgi:hypothetical protein